MLRIAERTGAIVVSNDSFQEFHGEHPWLFDEGRLIGGKPVPGVGGSSRPRLPVRGVKSRAATAREAGQGRPRLRSGQGGRAGQGGQEGGQAVARPSGREQRMADHPAQPPPARRQDGHVKDPELSTAIDEAVAEALEPRPAVDEGHDQSAAKKKATTKKATTKKAAPAKKEAGQEGKRQKDHSQEGHHQEGRGQETRPKTAAN